MRQFVFAATIVGACLIVLAGTQLGGGVPGQAGSAAASSPTPTPRPTLTGSHAPVANNGEANALSGYWITLTVQGHDDDFCGGGQQFSAVPLTLPQHSGLYNGSAVTCQNQSGTALLTATWQYDADIGFVGDDSFTFTFSDGLSMSNTATFTIHVADGGLTPTPVATPSPTPSPTPTPSPSPTPCSACTPTPSPGPTSTPTSSPTPTISPPVTGTPAPGPDIALLAVDMNVGGNTLTPCSGEGCSPGTRGAIERCAEVDPGQDVVIDIVVDSIPNVVTGSGTGPDIAGLDMDLILDPAIVQVVARNMNGMEYFGSPAGSMFSNTETAPDSDGQPSDFRMSEANIGGVGESGPGLLARLQLHALASGISTLHLQDTLVGTGPSLYDHSGSANRYSIATVQDGLIAVHPSTCSSPTSTSSPTTTFSPTPTPSSGPTSTPTSTPTPTPSSGPTSTSTSAPTPTPMPTPTATPTCPNGVLPAWPVPSGDSDCDGFPDSVAVPQLASEAFLGTDATQHCAADNIQNNEPPPDRWPVDFNDDQLVSGGDFLVFAPVYGGISPAPRYDARFDLNGDGRISGGDFLVFSPFFGKRCA